MFNDEQKILEKYAEKIEALKTNLKIEEKMNRVEVLRDKSEAEGFWDNQTKAQEIIKK